MTVRDTLYGDIKTINIQEQISISEKKHEFPLKELSPTWEEGSGTVYLHCLLEVHCFMNESTAGADASVEALKLYHMLIAYLLCYSASSSLNLHCTKNGK